MTRVLPYALVRTATVGALRDAASLLPEGSILEVEVERGIAVRGVHDDTVVIDGGVIVELKAVTSRTGRPAWQPIGCRKGRR